MTQFYNQYKNLFFGQPFQQYNLSSSPHIKNYIQQQNKHQLKFNQIYPSTSTNFQNPNQKQILQNHSYQFSNPYDNYHPLNNNNQSFNKNNTSQQARSNPITRKKYQSTIITPSYQFNNQFKSQILSKLQQLNNQKIFKSQKRDQDIFRKLDQLKYPHLIQNKNRNVKQNYFNNYHQFQYQPPKASSGLPQQEDYSIGKSYKKNLSSQIQKALHFQPTQPKKQIHSDLTHKKQPFGKPSTLQKKSFKSIFQMDDIQDLITLDIKKQSLKNKKKAQFTVKPLPNNKKIYQMNENTKKDQFNSLRQKLRKYNEQQLHNHNHHIPQISHKTALHKQQYEYFYNSRNQLKSRSKSRQNSRSKDRKVSLKITDKNNQNNKYLLRYQKQQMLNHNVKKEAVSNSKFNELNPENTLQQQQQLRQRVGSPIDFSQYQKQNQYQFVNKRLDDMKKIEHYHPRGLMNAYQQALQRRKQTKSKNQERKRKIKHIMKIQEGQFYQKQRIF